MLDFFLSNPLLVIKQMRIITHSSLLVLICFNDRVKGFEYETGPHF